MKNLIVFGFIVCLAFLLGSLVDYTISDDEVEASKKKIIQIKIDGTINPATVDYIRSGIDKAKEKDAEALLILLDTPGGLLNSTQDIVKLILNSPVPVIIYVHPSGATATSAGVFITLSAHVAAMTPGTSIGAAHPVMIAPGGRGPTPEDGKDKKDGKEEGDKEKDKLREKIENFAISFIETIAEKRGRNAKWAIDAVKNSASITDKKALKEKVIDLVANNIDDLLEKIDGRQVELPGGKTKLRTKNVFIEKLEMNIKQKFIDTLSTPDIAFLLLSLGSLGLLIEFYNPGLIFPGVAVGISLILGMVSLQILPFNYGGLALLLLAIVLFITEIYVTSYGLLTVGAVISLIIGALLLFQTPESDVRVSLKVIISVTSAITLFSLFIGYHVIKAQVSTPYLGFEGLVGEEGVAESGIAAVGKVFIHGEYWDAESDEPIEKGDRVEVVEARKFKLKVKKTKSK